MPIVTNPTAGDVHVNRPLTNFSQRYIQSADLYIASRAMPNLPVTHQSDLYYEFNRADTLRDEAVERADGTESAGGSFRLSTSTYFARVYAYHKDVTDRQRQNQDTLIALDRSATAFVTQKLLIKREILFRDAYMVPGVWTTDVTPSPLWDAASSDPIVDIRAGKKVVQGLTGYRPNRMIMGRAVYDALLDNDAILGRIIGGATTVLPAMIMKQRLTELLELDEIFIMDSIYNTAPLSKSSPNNGVYAFLADKHALLYYAPTTVTIDEPTAGVQFSWNGFMGATSSGQRIKKMRAELLEADRVEGQMAFDYKLTGPDLGYFFEDAVS